jgi:hypothetical protein
MDQWQKFEGMSSDRLVDEIQTLNKKLFSLNPNSSMYNQLLGIIRMADQVYRDKMYVDQVTDPKQTKVIDIGEIETQVSQPNYGANLLDVVVESYVSSVRDNKK